jgi:hypothetical protein
MPSHRVNSACWAHRVGRPARYGSSHRPSMLARDSPNVLHEPCGRRPLALGFLSHLYSFMVTMSQKSSVLQPANSVSQVLTPDTKAFADLPTDVDVKADIIFQVFRINRFITRRVRIDRVDERRAFPIGVFGLAAQPAGAALANTGA